MLANKPFLHIHLLLFLTFVPELTLGQPPASVGKVYVCPPCGTPCDSVEHRQPGACTVCGMTLIEKGDNASSPMAHAASENRPRVAILIFEGVQIIDYTAPWEVFGQAGFEVITVAEKLEPITTAMGMSVNPAYTLANHPKANVVLLPGGNVPNHQSNPKIIDWIRRQAEQAQVVLSVCNGAFFLAKAGLLDGREATTFASLIPGLQAAAPKAHVVSDKRFVDNGKIVTSAGLSSGIDASLHVVEKLRGKGRAQVVAVNLEYNWDPEGKYVRAALADKHLNPLFGFMRGYTREVLNHEGGTDNWRTQWQVHTDSTTTAMLALIDDHLAASEKWSHVKELEAKVESSSAWQFSDEAGKRWLAKVRVQPMPEEQHQLLVSITIEKEATH